MISIRINDIPLQLEAPVNLVEAAAMVGVHIPHLCYHPDLSIHGKCRICMVELKGSPKLLPACMTMAEDGMDVVTNTDKINQIRRGVLGIQLSTHPFDCPTCDKGGECRLQDYVHTYGADVKKYAASEEKPNYDNPLIERNMARCVNCRRCIRVCSEVQADDVYEAMAGKGPNDKIVTDESKCVHCGHCIAVCPVGAIQSRMSLHTYRPWYIDSETTTVCPYCGDGCRLKLQARKGRIIRAVSLDEKAPGLGSLCVKGRFGYDVPNSVERLTKPLIKKSGGFVEATWDEALGLVAKRLAEITAANGPDAVGALIGGRNTNEEAYLLQKFIRTAVGTNNIDNTARLGHLNALMAIENTAGLLSFKSEIRGIAEAKSILVIGTDPMAENPITGLAVKKAVRKNEAKLIVADAGRNGSRKFAAQSLDVKPGSLGRLARAIVSVLFAEGLYDKSLESDEVAEPGFFSKLSAWAKAKPLSAMCADAGVAEADVAEAARTLASEGRTAIIFGAGVTASANGYADALAVARLWITLGGAAKVGIYPMAAKAGEQGACDMGALPDMLPGYRKVTSASERGRVSGLWNVVVPEKPGLDLFGMLSGGLKAMYVIGADLVSTLPGGAGTAAALSAIDFLVVQDIFMTETAKLADVVLPAAAFAEKDGTFTNSERRVQRITAVIEPVGDSRPDGRIIADIATLMGRPMRWKASEVREGVSVSTPPYAGINFALLKRRGIQWPVKLMPCELRFGSAEGEDAGIQPNSPGGFYADFSPSLYHSGTMTRRALGLNKVAGSAYAAFNPEDAARLGMAEAGECVRATVKSETGSVTLDAKIDASVPKGIVHIPDHFAGAGVSGLIASGHAAARFWPVAVEIIK
jgi:predicted molibdopterin-dependent oxidoreductase YjgC